jgi:hypothetical protein
VAESPRSGLTGRYRKHDYVDPAFEDFQKRQFSEWFTGEVPEGQYLNDLSLYDVFVDERDFDEFRQGFEQFSPAEQRKVHRGIVGGQRFQEKFIAARFSHARELKATQDEELKIELEIDAEGGEWGRLAGVFDSIRVVQRGIIGATKNVSRLPDAEKDLLLVKILQASDVMGDVAEVGTPLFREIVGVDADAPRQRENRKKSRRELNAALPRLVRAVSEMGPEAPQPAEPLSSWFEPVKLGELRPELVQELAKVSRFYAALSRYLGEPLGSETQRILSHAVGVIRVGQLERARSELSPGDYAAIISITRRVGGALTPVINAVDAYFDEEHRRHQLKEEIRRIDRNGGGESEKSRLESQITTSLQGNAALLTRIRVENDRLKLVVNDAGEKLDLLGTGKWVVSDKPLALSEMGSEDRTAPVPEQERGRGRSRSPEPREESAASEDEEFLSDDSELPSPAGSPRRQERKPVSLSASEDEEIAHTSTPRRWSGGPTSVPPPGPSARGRTQGGVG